MVQIHCIKNKCWKKNKKNAGMAITHPQWVHRQGPSTGIYQLPAKSDGGGNLCLRERRCGACPERLLSSQCFYVPQRHFVVALNWWNYARLSWRINEQTTDTRPCMKHTMINTGHWVAEILVSSFVRKIPIQLHIGNSLPAVIIILVCYNYRQTTTTAITVNRTNYKLSCRTALIQ